MNIDEHNILELRAKTMNLAYHSFIHNEKEGIKHDYVFNVYIMCVHMKENPRRPLLNVVCYVELTKGLLIGASTMSLWMSFIAIKKEKLQGGMGFLLLPSPPKIHHIIQDKQDLLTDFGCRPILSNLSSSELQSKPRHKKCNITDDHTNWLENISSFNWAFSPP